MLLTHKYGKTIRCKHFMKVKCEINFQKSQCYMREMFLDARGTAGYKKEVSETLCTTLIYDIH